MHVEEDRAMKWPAQSPRVGIQQKTSPLNGRRHLFSLHRRRRPTSKIERDQFHGRRCQRNNHCCLQNQCGIKALLLLLARRTKDRLGGSTYRLRERYRSFKKPVESYSSLLQRIGCTDENIAAQKGSSGCNIIIREYLAEPKAPQSWSVVTGF